VIVEINRKPVSGTEDFLDAVAQITRGSVVLLRIQRQNASLYIAVTAA
jgi:S1-C subfamily serine protease